MKPTSSNDLVYLVMDQDQEKYLKKLIEQEIQRIDASANLYEEDKERDSLVDLIQLFPCDKWGEWWTEILRICENIELRRLLNDK